MSFNFHLPDIGEGVVEGEIVSWKVAVGDPIALDQPMVEVMTDKATVEIPAPRAGTIKQINFKEGEICPVGDVLVVIEEAGGKAAGGKAVAPPQAPPASKNGNGAHAPMAAGATKAELPTPPRQDRAKNQPMATASASLVDVSADRQRVKATPATRRLARQMSVDITTVPATGKHGRVTSDDVRGFAENGGSSAGQSARANGAGSAQSRAFEPLRIEDTGAEERVPLRGMRKRIAENMTRSVFTATHFTYVEEVDMTELVEVRERAKSRAQARDIKLTYLPFIVKAIVSNLRKWPQLNASLDESTQEIVLKKYYHIGIAAQGPQGLAVSVLRDADRRSIFDLAQEIQRLGDAVRTGTASREELTGSTFTITSLGKLGGVLATPIINFPEVGIVGVHKMEQKPAIRDGEIVARWLMNLSISLDHRLVDGWDGAMFLQDVKSFLEDPTTMFLEMV